MVAFLENGITIVMVGIGMGMTMGMTLMSGMAEWQVSLERRLAWEQVWNVGMLHIWRLRWTRKLVYIDRCCCYDWR